VAAARTIRPLTFPERRWLLVLAPGLVWLAWLLSLPPRPPVWAIFLSGVPLLGLACWAHTAPGKYPTLRTALRDVWDVYALALVVLFALAIQFADTHGVTTDGVIYFSQLRSVLYDRDLDVAAEFAFLEQPPRPSHVVPVGPTFLWLPLYGAVAIVDAGGRALGMWHAPPSATGVGLTLPFIRAALVSSFLVGALGLFLVHRRLRGEFPKGVALAGTLLIFLATPLVWYMVYEPSMTHAASFGLVAAFIVTAERYTSPAITPKHAVWLGLLLGLAFLTRPQEAVFALFPAIVLMMANAPARVRLRATVRLASWAFLGALPCLVAQAVHTSVLLQQERFVLAGSGGYLNPWASRWADTLWSSWHGFFSWSPVAYIACVAAFFYVARNRRWAVATVTIVFVMAWVNGATTDWAGGWSFGGRRFTSVLVLLAPPLALALFALWRRPLVALAMVSAVMVAWNQLLVTQYDSGRLAPSRPVTFAQIVRQQAALATEPPFFYPFAFPANAWFAWRTGLPIDRYDLLSPESPGPSATITMRGDSAKYLMEGWSARVSDPFGDLRWIDGARAEIVVPATCAHEVGRDVMLHVTARTRQLDPPDYVTLAVSVNGREVGTVQPALDRASTTRYAFSPQHLASHGFQRVLFERRSGGAPVGVYGVALCTAP
jgi:hypothetical protein